MGALFVSQNANDAKNNLTDIKIKNPAKIETINKILPAKVIRTVPLRTDMITNAAPTNSSPMASN